MTAEARFGRFPPHIMRFESRFIKFVHIFWGYFESFANKFLFGVAPALHSRITNQTQPVFHTNVRRPLNFFWVWLTTLFFEVAQYTHKRSQRLHTVHAYNLSVTNYIHYYYLFTLITTSLCVVCFRGVVFVRVAVTCIILRRNATKIGQPHTGHTIYTTLATRPVLKIVALSMHRSQIFSYVWPPRLNEKMETKNMRSASVHTSIGCRMCH